MSYQVLARKWRPRFFDEMVGQEHVLKALINALNDGRLHHAYLFTGTRGVGKTTIARILAKCLNCEEGVSARPCGVCSSCREISEGRFVDLIEVDAASRTRVEDTRELLDNVQYAPTRGRFKVYLIDEVHMLSTHSFNALLKTLEEPPAHVKFLLATTDPQKLPVTVLSRCLQFSLKNMTPERIVQYLGHVLKEENIGYEEAALWSLGRAAQGSMRDALSLTDQAIAYGEGKVGEEQVNAMLGTMNRGHLFRLAGLMAQGDAAAILREVAVIAEHSPDYDEILQGLLHIWHKTALAQLVADAVDNTEGDQEAIRQLAQTMAAEDLQLYYQIGLQGRKDLSLAPEPRQGFEMVLLRMLAFRPAPEVMPELDLESLLEKKKSLTESGETAPAQAAVVTTRPAVVETEPAAAPVLPPSFDPVDAGARTEPVAEDDNPPWEINPADATETALAVEETPEPESGEDAQLPPGGFAGGASDPSEQPAQQPAPPLAEAQRAVPASAQAGPGNMARALLDGASAAVPGVQPEPQPEGQPGPTSASDDPVTVDSHEEAAVLPELSPHTWWQWVEHLPLAGLPMAIARNSALTGMTDGTLEFDVDPGQGALYNDSQKERIQTALRTLLPEVRISMTLCPPRGETPEQRRQRQQAEARWAAQQAIDSDPLVNQILNELGGYVIEDSVRPN